MLSSTEMSKSHLNEQWKQGIFQRIRRIEGIVFITAVVYNDFIPNQIFTNKKHKLIDLSALSEINDSISSLRDIQDAMALKIEQETSKYTSMIEKMNDQISDLLENNLKATDIKSLEVNTEDSIIASSIMDTSQYEEMKLEEKDMDDLYNKKEKTKDIPQYSILSKPTKTIYDVSDETMALEDLHSRKLQSHEIVAPCSAKEFVLQRDFVDLEGLRFELFDISANATVPLNTDSTKKNMIACIQPAPHRLSIFDDVLVLDDKNLVEHTIYIDNIIILKGSWFFREIHHYFDTSQQCIVDSLFSLEIYGNMNDAPNLNWTLRDAFSNKVTSLVPNMVTNDGEVQSYYSCVPSGTYIFDISNTEDIDRSTCEDPNDCFSVSINDEFLFSEKDSNEKLPKRFYVSKSGNATLIREPGNHCQRLPIISPENVVNNFAFDETLSKKIQVVQSLSSKDALDRYDSPQYKAICWALYDDPFLSPRDILLFERYTLAVLFFSTQQMDRIEYPRMTCDYDGIVCNDRGLISRIFWSNAIHQGTLPPEISHLSDLESLALFQFKLTGTIPWELERLINVKELYLSQNKLTGTIPLSIGRLTDLEILWLKDNELSGSIASELFQCSQMKSLSLGNNQLYGTIPTEVNLLQQLISFDAKNNNLIGTIPSEIGALSNLSDLLLFSNHLTGTIPEELGNLESLQRLSLQHNNLTGTIPDIFRNLDALYIANFEFNRLDGSLPNSLWDLDMKANHPSKLYTLYFSNNNIEGSVPDDFCPRTMLDFMGKEFVNMKIDDSSWFLNTPKVECNCCDSGNCAIWEINFESVAGTKRPVCVGSVHDVSYRIYGGVFDRINDNVYIEAGVGTSSFCLSQTGCYTVFRDLGFMSDLPESYKLSFSNSSKGLVREQSHCDSVNLCGYFFSEDNPKREGLNHLTQIAVSNLAILEDPSSPAYKAMCWLMTKDTLYDDYTICDGRLLQRYVLILLYLSHNVDVDYDRLTMEDTCDWKGVTCDDSNKFVEKFEIDGGKEEHKLEGILITELGLLTRLKTIILHHNAFVGTIDPSIFEYMPHLETLDVGNNTLEGEIPKEILMLPNLKRLDLSKNLFIESLPTDTEYPKSLEIMNVAENLLKGTIPQALFECKNLQVIDFSRNNFIGSISSAFGNLKNLHTIFLNENRLTGSIPPEILGSKVKSLMLQSNDLTGSIPTELGLLHNAEKITLNHNTLEGSIPRELEQIKGLKMLHLYHNQLTGDAPKMTFTKEKTHNENYITDCGDPSYLDSELECKSCTMCCNSLDQCQIRRIFEFPLWLRGILYFSIIPAVIGIIGVLDKKNIVCNYLTRHRSVSNIYSDESVYSFIFSNHFWALSLYILTLVIQVSIFALYLDASNSTSEESDWQYSFHCPKNDNECKDETSIDELGWVQFIAVTVFYIGSDFILSILQLLKAVSVKDGRMLISGLILYYLTALAIIATILYNIALAEENTDLIMNSVILFFIVDMDEKFLGIIQRFAPIWVEDRAEEIKYRLVSKFIHPDCQNSDEAKSTDHAPSKDLEETTEIPTAASASLANNTSQVEDTIWAW